MSPRLWWQIVLCFSCENEGIVSYLVPRSHRFKSSSWLMPLSPQARHLTPPCSKGTVPTIRLWESLWAKSSVKCKPRCNYLLQAQIQKTTLYSRQGNASHLTFHSLPSGVGTMPHLIRGQTNWVQKSQFNQVKRSGGLTVNVLCYWLKGREFKSQRCRASTVWPLGKTFNLNCSYNQ